MRLKRKRNRWLKWGGLALFLLLMAELSAGYLYFQRGSDPGPALSWLADRLGRQFGQSGFVPNVARTLSPTQAGRLQSALEQAYQAEFSAFHAGAQKAACHFFVVYQPSPAPDLPTLQPLFQSLSADASARFIDLTSDWPVTEGAKTHFLPEDMHPSRYANGVAAERLSQILNRLDTAGCPPIGELSPGPWPAGVDEIREPTPGRPYRFTTDADGYRWSGQAQSDAPDATVLMLGDSFLFGSSLADTDTLPAQLAEKMKGNWRVLNAGVGGTTIVQQVANLAITTRTHRPTVLLLFVNDTDLRDLIDLMDQGADWIPANHEELKAMLTAD